MTITKFAFALTILACCMLSMGCNNQGDYNDYNEAEKHAPDDEHEHDEHAHGPHGGHVVELGDENYHAEVVMDEKSRDITIYLYGSDHDMKETSPVKAESIALNLKVADKPVSLVVKANAQEGDQEGTTSRFQIAGDQVPESIHDAEDLAGELNLVVDGKGFRGPITHNHHHDHDEHDHDGDDHDHKDGDKDKKEPIKKPSEG